MIESSPFAKTLNEFMLLLKAVMIIVFIGFLFSGTTLINPDEVGIVLRFGKIRGENPAEIINQPGWLFALPRPIDKIVRVPVRQIREVRITEVSAAQTDPDIRTRSIDPVNEGYLISGDENVFQAVINVKYQIVNPIEAVFNFYGGDKTLESVIHDLTISEMVKVAGRLTIDGILSEDQKQLALMASQRLQLLLNELNSGVEIVAVEFEEVAPPAFLKRDFEEVNTAFINRRNYISEAEGRREQMLPGATGQASRIVNQARSYREEVVSAAAAEADSFLKLLEAYQKNPGETRMMLADRARKAVFRSGARLIMFPDQNGFEVPVVLSLNDGSSSSALPVPVIGDDFMHLYTEDGDQ